MYLSQLSVNMIDGASHIFNQCLLFRFLLPCSFRLTVCRTISSERVHTLTCPTLRAPTRTCCMSSSSFFSRHTIVMHHPVHIHMCPSWSSALFCVTVARTSDQLTAGRMKIYWRTTLSVFMKAPLSIKFQRKCCPQFYAIEIERSVEKQSGFTNWNKDV